MNNYEVVMYWDETDGIFVAEAPELPGCMSHGDTRADALSNIEQAIAGWLESARAIGRDIPTPCGRFVYS